MASSKLVRLVVVGGGGSLLARGATVLFVAAFDSLGGGALYEFLLGAGGKVQPDASYIIQAVMPPYLRSLKQGIENLRQSLQEFSDTLLEVEETLEAEAEAQAQAPQEDSSSRDGGGKGAAAAILSMAEVCRELGMSKSWVYNRVRSGQIPSIKLGGAIKIKRADLDEYIEKQPYQSFD
jgi:excisionase family DNA binding protein